MFTFGNVQGALIYANDNLRQLNGASYDDLQLLGGGQPSTAGIWPIPAYVDEGGTVQTDYPSYIRAQLDGKTINIVGDGTQTYVRDPYFIPGTGLSYQVNLGAAAAATGQGGTTTTGGTSTIAGFPAGLILEQDILPLRATMQITWKFINADSASHTVSLRWTTMVRGGTPSTLPGNTTNDAFFDVYFVDPNTGIPQPSPILYGNGTAIPSALTFYGSRYEPDAGDGTPFASRITFPSLANTLNSVPVNEVYLSDTQETYPGNGGFLPAFASSQFVRGLAASAYFGPVAVAPGQTFTAMATYGNGTPTEASNQSTVVGGESTVIGTEAIESLQYNENAANTLPTSGNSGLTAPQISAAFMEPSPFKVYADLYNTTVAQGTSSVPIENLNMTLSFLQPGLQLGVQDDGVTAETPTKSVSAVSADTDGVVNWNVVPDGTNFGPLTYNVHYVSSSPINVTYDLTRVVNVPVTPVHTVSSTTFQMIGFPFQFDPTLSNNSDPATIINGSPLSQQPPDSNPAFFQWVIDPSIPAPYNGSWQKATALTPGIGYFYKSNTSGTGTSGTRTLFLLGADPVAYSSSPLQDFDPVNQQIIPTGDIPKIISAGEPLQAGWNMISIPLVYPMPLSTLEFAAPQVSLSKLPYSDAVTADYISDAVYIYDTNTQAYDSIYTPTTLLQPYSAYWIYANEPLQMSFTVPTQRQSAVLPSNTGTIPTKAVVVGALASGRAFPAHPTMSNWKLQLVTHRGSEADPATLFGEVAGASDAATSRTTLPKPPPMSFQPFVYAGLLNTANDGGASLSVAASHAAAATGRTAGDFAQLMRPADGSSKSWDFEVKTNSDGPVTLTWPNLRTLPRTLDLKLVDAQTGEITSLRNTSSVTVNVKAATASRFRIVADTAPSLPLSMSALHVVKVAGGSRAAVAGTGSAYTFGFSLTQNASVTARVSTVTGRVVRTVTSGQPMTSGNNNLLWNGLSDAGTQLPVGAYLVQMTAVSADGQMVRVLQPLLLVR
jgi:hypothetical protein